MPLSAESPSQRNGPGQWAARYALAVGIVAAATLVRQLVDPLIHDQIPYFVYVASVVVATWFCGVGGGVLSAVAAAFAGNYFFVAPRYEFWPRGEDWMAMALFGAVAGGLVGLVGRWKNAEETLQRQARRLEALHREAERVNRVKDEFLATLSHELRTPLNAIVGWAHLLAAGGLDASRQKTAAQTILRNAVTQGRLVDDLLDVSRIISGKLHLQLAPVDMVPVVTEAIELVRNAANAKGIELCASLPPRALLVGDEERLRQIVWNLLSNAVKFTPKHGRVHVQLECRNSQAELTVVDTGVGLDADFIPHLFERFSQADSSTTRRHGGLGLGLAVVRHLVELHGGTVSASSRGRNQGATLTVTLPVRAVMPASHAERAMDRRETPGAVQPGGGLLQGLRVLVVDDEPDARDLVEAVLAQQGAEVDVAASAHEAFQRVRQWRPDVLIADIGMPVEDGYSLLRRIRGLSATEGGSIPAAALTAYAQAGDRERALAAGFQEHVAKPVPPQRLVDVVANLARDAASARWRRQGV